MDRLNRAKDVEVSRAVSAATLELKRADFVLAVRTIGAVKVEIASRMRQRVAIAAALREGLGRR